MTNAPVELEEEAVSTDTSTCLEPYTFNASS